MSKLPTDKGGAGPAWLKKLEQVSGGTLAGGRERTAVAAGGGAVILAVDCSGSMADDKLEQARAGASDFGRDALRRGYSVGVLQFGSAAEDILAPSRSEDGIRSALGRLQITGSTNMAAGIERAAATLGNGGNRVICIVTDGMPDSVNDALSSAARARSRGIEIMAVGTDDADWTFLSQIVSRHELASKVDRQQLGRQIAAMAKMLPLLPPRKS